MKTETRDAILQIAMETMSSAKLYCEVSLTDEQDAHFDDHGSVDVDGHEVVLLAQTQQANIYGYEVKNAADANYLVSEAYGSFATPEIAVMIRVLDALFGSTDDWPDNYAQTNGWDIK